MATVIRLLLLASLVFGGYKLYPIVRPNLPSQLTDPRAVADSVIPSVISAANTVLPDKFDIKPVPTVAGVSTSTPSSAPTSTPSSSISNTSSAIIDSVKQKATDMATKAVCQALLEKLQSECAIDK